MFREIKIGIIELLLYIPVGLFAIMLHEYVKGWLAQKFGDTTQEQYDLLHWKPLAFVDPLGFITLIWFHGLGWTRPMLINPEKMSDGKSGAAAAMLAGPLVNIAAALVLSVVWWMIYPVQVRDRFTGSLLMALIEVNFKLGVINLLPILPFTGGHIVALFIKGLHRYEIIAIIITLGLFVWIYAGGQNNIFDRMIFTFMQLFRIPWNSQ